MMWPQAERWRFKFMSRKTKGGGGSAYRGDRFTKQAKAQGYTARSVFKLEEIDRKAGLTHQPFSRCPG